MAQMNTPQTATVNRLPMITPPQAPLVLPRVVAGWMTARRLAKNLPRSRDHA